jgi:predicted Zn finger-like uncharacterized protein
MIVQCEECKTNFNLDEKRLRGDSAKVRCSKCRHVFMIYKNQEEPALSAGDTLFEESAPTAVIAADSIGEATSVFDGGFDFQESTAQLTVEEPFAATFDSLSIPPAEEPAATASAETASFTSDDFAFSDMTFSDKPTEDAAAQTITAPSKPAFDEDMLSFADVAPSDEEETTPAAIKDSFDFSFSAGEETTATPPSADKTSFDFDFGGDSEPEKPTAPAETFDLGGLDFSVPTPQTAAIPAPTEAPDEPFTFQADEPSAPTFVPVPSAEDTESENAWAVYRPFAIAGACATVVIGLLTAGYFYIKGAPGNLERMGIQNVGASAEAEKGSFTITNPKAMFVKNKASGELFVVSANALNGYKGPRTGVEVQVTLFGKNGAELGVKTAYCGSTIEEEQLTTLPYAAIDAELTKEPSDDPLENTPVEAGKTASCLVVFKDVPKQATDYGIEVIASHSEKLDDF